MFILKRIKGDMAEQSLYGSMNLSAIFVSEWECQLALLNDWRFCACLMQKNTEPQQRNQDNRVILRKSCQCHVNTVEHTEKQCLRNFELDWWNTLGDGRVGHSMQFWCAKRCDQTRFSGGSCVLISSVSLFGQPSPIRWTNNAPKMEYYPPWRHSWK